ncbi:MAG: signal peptidase I [Burkholderiaceae bacterium]|nr:signal peptidase I [Burkholderiaceae bacterium]
MNKIPGDFEGVLLAATVITLVYWLAERFYFAPRRRAVARAATDAQERRRAELIAQGVTPDEGAQQAQERDAGKTLAMPWWLDWTAGLFPVILIVFALRSFVIEPFHIPSGSMIPTLWIGDFVLVNKFTYGLRLPVIGTRLTAGKPVARGDVVVFHYPLNPSEDYIKRVVGLPGDEVTYVDKRLTVNGQLVPETPAPDFFDESTTGYYKQFNEQFGATTHAIMTNDQVPTYIREGVRNFQYRSNCSYTLDGFTCKVPAGHYFMMGDNRDNSDDSRYWGFVPEGNVVGRAFLIWMNFNHFGRIGAFK